MLQNEEKTKAGEHGRVLLAVTKATRFELDKHPLIAAAILLPYGILSGTECLRVKRSGRKVKGRDKPALALES